MSPAPPLLASLAIRSPMNVDVFRRAFHGPDFTITPPNIHTASYPRAAPHFPAQLAIRSFNSPSATSPSPGASPTLTVEQYITSIAPAVPSSATTSPAPAPSPSPSSASSHSKLTVVLAGTLAPIVFILLALSMLWVFVYRRRRRRRRRHDQATPGTNEDEEAEWVQVMISAQAGPFSMPLVQRLTAPLKAASLRAFSIKSDARGTATVVEEATTTSLASSGSASQLVITVTPADRSLLTAAQPALRREHILARASRPRMPTHPIASSGGMFMPDALIVPLTPTDEDDSTLAASVGPSISSEKAGLPVKVAEPPVSPYTSPRDAPAPVMLSRAPSFKTFASLRGDLEPPPEYARPLPRTPG
ncbi:hypothetical protein FB45DRAFT_1029985 [Roridomyces roridus]|uniref:Uncharacterized protein n=1 Tax=Roridomyces roridus TaxID=1738132 RepID=A0AAD7BMM4_9AGAR|nr:hypothetical protein FB45DRAFT_1029985 [Roridomyces roridus]